MITIKYPDVGGSWLEQSRPYVPTKVLRLYVKEMRLESVWLRTGMRLVHEDTRKRYTVGEVPQDNDTFVLE